MKPEILIAKIKHSTNPIILVEGREDIVIYRKIEKYLGLRNIQFFPCQGRENLFKIFEMRTELQNVKVLFVADQDMYIFGQIPSHYQEIIFTSGYSIENDLYTDGKTQIDKLLFPNELQFKIILLQSIIHWFTYEVALRLSGNESGNRFSDVSILSENVSEIGSAELKNTFLAARGFSYIAGDLQKEIQAEYPLKLRGKFIFQVYTKINRDLRTEKEDTSYTKEQLWDLCFHSGKNTAGSCMQTLISKIHSQLAS